MKTIFPIKGIAWAIKQFIGPKALKLMVVHDHKLLVREVASRFSLPEEGLMRLIAAKLDLLYMGDVDDVNAQINHHNFSVDELREKGFVIYSAGIESVKLLCYDPAKLRNLNLKNDKRRIELALSSWETVSKLITKVQNTPIEARKPIAENVTSSNVELLWKVFAQVLKNVEEGSGSSFELTRDRKKVNYAFVDSGLLMRYGDIDYTIGSQLIELLTNISYREPSFKREFLSSSYSIHITALPTKGAVFVKFKRGESVEPPEEERVYFTPPKRVEARLH